MICPQNSYWRFHPNWLWRRESGPHVSARLEIAQVGERTPNLALADDSCQKTRSIDQKHHSPPAPKNMFLPTATVPYQL